MIPRVKNLLVRLLLRLVDPGDFEVAEEENKAMESWLARSYQDGGCQAFLKFRRDRINRQLASGYAMNPNMSHEYARHVGQKAEGLIVGIHMKKAHQRAEEKGKIRRREQQERVEH